MSAVISDKSVVTVHYKLTDDQGNVLDSSEGSKPMAYLHGAGNIIPGLEKALEGKAEGDSLQVRVEPGEAYGYASGCPLGTSSGTMEGTYLMSVQDGEQFNAQIPAFSLETPGVRRLVN